MTGGAFSYIMVYYRTHLEFPNCHSEYPSGHKFREESLSIRRLRQRSFTLFRMTDKIMSTGFWKKLKKPIMVLAPMANVTDAAFRQIIAKYGKPDVMYTEFVACDGLMSAGQKKLLVDFMYTEAERPIVAQIFGSKPENFYKTALLIQELGFDGIDINMGCPDRNVEKQGAGACLMKNPQLAQEIIRATKRGAGKLPVSVNT